MTHKLTQKNVEKSAEPWPDNKITQKVMTNNLTQKNEK